MRSLHATKAGKAICLAVVGGILFQPAKADLRAVTQTDDLEGSRLELASPDGYSCRFTNAERPSLTVGAGIATSPVIQGVGNSKHFSEGRVADPQPVVGVVLRIPLGAKPENCDAIVKIETATMKARRAQELYELGLIELEQLKAIAERAYDVIATD